MPFDTQEVLEALLVLCQAIKDELANVHEELDDLRAMLDDVGSCVSDWQPSEDAMEDEDLCDDSKSDD